MLRLTKLLGTEALRDGRPAGRLRDLEVGPGERHPSVASVWVKPRRGTPAGFRPAPGLDWEARPFAVGEPLEGTPGGLLLREHVLDSQIVDLAGKRLARVGDVLLAGAGEELRLAGVEIGAAPLLRRLGLHRLAERARSEEIDWADIHLASAPGHELQLGMPKAAVHGLGEAELAALVEALPPARAEEVIRSKPAARAPARPAVRRRGRRFGNVMRARRRAPR
ncbi:MAG: hypothetical protein U0R52_08820 [Solirubrobacterales bacterium]